MILATSNPLVPFHGATCTGNILPRREAATVAGGCAGGIVRGEDVATLAEGALERRLGTIPTRHRAGFYPWSGWQVLGSGADDRIPRVIRESIDPSIYGSGTARRWFDASLLVGGAGTFDAASVSFAPATRDVGGAVGTVPPARMLADDVRRMYYDLKRMTVLDLHGCTKASVGGSAFSWAQGATVEPDGTTSVYTGHKTTVETYSDGTYRYSESGAMSARPLSDFDYPHDDVKAHSDCYIRGGYAVVQFAITNGASKWIVVPFGTGRTIDKSAWDHAALVSYLDAEEPTWRQGGFYIVNAGIVALAYDIHFPVAVEDVTGWNWAPSAA